MSLKPSPIGPVPELTAYVARAAYPDGNPYLAVRDALGTFFDDQRFAGLFPDRGRPAEAPWRLALVTVLQFAGGPPAPSDHALAGYADRSRRLTSTRIPPQGEP